LTQPKNVESLLIRFSHAPNAVESALRHRIVYLITSSDFANAFALFQIHLV